MTDEKTPPKHDSIAAALAAAQAEMGRAAKSASNPHFRTKYADLDSVCDAALPALNRHGIAVIQPLENREGQWVQLTRFLHGQSGETLETPVPLLVGKNDMQGFGSAMTYARRYGLMSLAGIAPEDDDGNAAAANPPPAQRQTPPQPPKEAIEGATSSLNSAETLEQLKAIFTGLPRAVQSVPDVIAAKDKRKAELMPDTPPTPGPDETYTKLPDDTPKLDDELPY